MDSHLIFYDDMVFNHRKCPNTHIIPNCIQLTKIGFISRLKAISDTSARINHCMRANNSIVANYSFFSTVARKHSAYDAEIFDYCVSPQSNIRVNDSC